MASKWIAHCPMDTKCSNTDCKNLISKGDVCVEHSGPIYGYSCKVCGEQYPKIWAGPLPAGPLPETIMADTPEVADLVSYTHKDMPGEHATICESPEDWYCTGGCSSCLTGKQMFQWHMPDGRVTGGAWCFECAAKKGLLPHGTGNNSPLKITSFGIKHGKPAEAKYVFDVRKTVRNPWRLPELRKKNGLDPDVVRYIVSCPAVGSIVLRVAYEAISSREAYVACWGGKHRSVAIAELAAKKLNEMGYKDVVVTHRDLGA